MTFIAKTFADNLHQHREREGAGGLVTLLPLLLHTESLVPLSASPCKDVTLLTHVFSVFLVLELNCEFVGVKTVVICFEVDIIIRLITIIDIMSLADSDVAFCYSFVNI